AQVQRGTYRPPRQVRPEVPRALEAVCCKALSLEPADRYATLQALAADVEHWLADEPVSAYPEPWAARAGRWLRRHRAFVPCPRAAGATRAGAGGPRGAGWAWGNGARGGERSAKQVAQRREAEALEQRARARQNLELAGEAVDRLLTRVGEGLANAPQMDPL